MSEIFLIAEIIHLIVISYVTFRYKKSAVLFIPPIYFIRYLYEYQLSPLLWYVVIFLLVATTIFHNKSFYKRSKAALFFFLYLIILLIFNSSENLNTSLYFNFSLLLISIPLINNICQNLDSKHVEKIIYKGSYIILIAFILNVALSSILGYSIAEGTDMYGFASRMSYGSMFAVHFNVLPVAILVVLLNNLRAPSLVTTCILILSSILILFSLRRSVIAVLLLVLLIAIVMYMYEKKNVKTFIYVATAGMVLILFSLSFNVIDNFYERVSHRGLDQGIVNTENESRLMEYAMVYNDIFVLNKYSAFTGYELFNSAGNYGNFTRERTLHSDVTTIVHATGLIGLLFYLYIFLKLFIKAYANEAGVKGKLYIIVLFLIFVVYAISGRITDISSVLLLTILVILPYTNRSISNTGFSAVSKLK